MRLVEDYLGKFDIYVSSNEHVGNRIVSDGEWEPWVVDFLYDNCPSGGVVLDIGANIGAHTIPMADAVGPDGAVLAFEPNPSVIDLLRTNIEANNLDNVEVHGVGISDSHGSSILKMRDDNFGASTLYHHDDGFEQSHFEVDLFPLTEFVTSADFLKIDVEGEEYNILSSIDLENFSSMAVEVHHQFLSPNQITEIESLLNSFGDVAWDHRHILWNNSQSF